MSADLDPLDLALARLVVAFHAPVEAACPDPDVPGPCWLATRCVAAARDPRQRRAVIPWRRRLPGYPATTARLAMTLLCGPLGDRQVLHACGVARCVNPAHWYLGDHAANQRDRRRHARLRAERRAA